MSPFTKAFIQTKYIGLINIFSLFTREIAKTVKRNVSTALNGHKNNTLHFKPRVPSSNTK